MTGLLELAKLLQAARVLSDTDHVSLEALSPSRATLPELARELAAAGTPVEAVPVRLVDDATVANTTARGRAGDARAPVVGDCHGFSITAPAGSLLTITRLEVTSSSGIADVQAYLKGRGGFTMPSPTGAAFEPILPLTVSQPRALVQTLTLVAPFPAALGVPLPFGFDEETNLVLRGHATFNANGEELAVWARTPNVEIRWSIEWTEEPLPAAQAAP